MNKEELLMKVREYVNEKEKNKFRPGIDEVPVSGALIFPKDIEAVVSCVLDGWFTEGEISKEFSKKLGDATGTRHVALCNSGSSANLLALTALAHQQPGNRNKSNLVITCATGFPTTVSAIYHAGLTPLFVDSAGYQKLNADDNIVLEALKRPDVVGVILAHTLGFPFRADLIRKRCDELGKFFIEDCCDALEARIGDNFVGSFGHASTLSFFPAHHITTGEGGAVCTNDGRLLKLIKSYRDWGRDCWCSPGEQNTCNKRFDWHLGTLPDGWDHKYTFTNIGYNLRMTEMQAALGLSQIGHLETFFWKRLDNYIRLYVNLFAYDGLYSIQPIPVLDVVPSPFGYPITVTSDKFTRQELVAFLENRKIRTRPVFGGNLTRHPAFRKMYFEQLGGLENSDYIMDRTLWIGCSPNLNVDQLNYVVESFYDFFRERGLN